ncbi:hypothetical protein [Streptomyces sp. B3I8]|uniref:hypothetical protein n=1 Tax=Streptomyces sp. B3I8 TaxID=3042303 RepID=UPI00277DF8A4|nr:hypothetical protein [Streptomyces sp. B3I8]MDQ0784615.1 hypothetical protein [Streptomyces sp. B3I8]
MSILDTSITAASAAFTGAAAYGAWKASRQANMAARYANETATVVAQIEQERWHRELTPQLRIKLQAEPHEVLYVRFDGPAKLGELHIELRIQDDLLGSRTHHMAGLTPEQRAEADEAVWGPYRFRPGVDYADALGRAVPAFPLLPGGRTRLAVDPSAALLVRRRRRRAGLARPLPRLSHPPLDDLHRPGSQALDARLRGAAGRQLGPRRRLTRDARHVPRGR